MSQKINDNFQVNAPKSLDNKYTKYVNGVSVPFASIAEANAAINIAYRYQGLQVAINDGSGFKVFVYSDGVADENLVELLQDYGFLTEETDPVWTADKSSYYTKTQVDSAVNAKQDIIPYTTVPNTRTVNGYPLSSNIALIKDDVGLSNVDNTSDYNKPVSNATSVALATKADLDTNGKVLLSQIPDTLIGQVKYQGTWDASANSPALTNPDSDTTKHGWYYVTTVAGTQFGIDFQVGDWAINDNGTIQKVDNTDAVSSVNGMYGAVVIDKTSVGLSNVQNIDTSLASNITTDATHRFVTDSDKSTWNAKQDALTFSTGLTNSGNTITSNVSTGKSGGQSIFGGINASEALTISSTANSTKGKILFGISAYDEANNYLGVRTNAPLYAFQFGNLTDTTQQQIALYPYVNIDSTATNSATLFTATGALSADSSNQGRGISITYNLNPNGFNSTNTSGNQVQFLSGILASTGTVYAFSGNNIRMTTSAAATVSNLAGQLIVSPNNSGGATITNAIGQVINQHTQGTNNFNFVIGGTNFGGIGTATGNYSIYNSSSYQNYFAGSLGIGTNAPTHTLTLSNAMTGIAQYNTSDQTTNYERFVSQWQSNVYTMGTYYGGSGTSIRSLQLGLQPTAGTTTLSGGRTFTINSIPSSTAGVFDATVVTGVTPSIFTIQGAASASSNTQNWVSIQPTINQSSTAGYTALLISPFENSTGSGNKYLINAGTASAANGGGTFNQKFYIQSNGTAYISGNIGIGVSPNLSGISVTRTISGNAWGTTGPGISVNASTFTDTSSSGTIGSVTVANSFGVPTFAASSTTTYTNAATLYVAGAPAAGTNVTITNPYALYVAGGTSLFAGVVAATAGISTQSSGSTLSNTANFSAAAGGSGYLSSTSSINIFGGASAIQTRSLFSGAFTLPLASNSSYSNTLIASSPVTTAASGTHDLLANLVVNPIGTVTSGGAAITSTATLYINGQSTAGTSNYSIWSAGGTNRLDGTNQIAFSSKAGDPTTSDIPAGVFMVWLNTTTGTLKVWANNSGTLKSVALS